MDTAEPRRGFLLLLPPPPPPRAGAAPEPAPGPRRCRPLGELAGPLRVAECGLLRAKDEILSGYVALDTSTFSPPQRLEVVDDQHLNSSIELCIRYRSDKHVICAFDPGR
ncbi:protein yippee-like 1 isoform X2 [Notamacropus eugenii]|uniref:protein yippee-like 1 isoform X2 n=1 Tax=Notamacropus eugenii TaxID=9315 RepID=UPI003B67D4EB